MAITFDFGETTMYLSALSTGRDLEPSARPRAPVDINLRVYEFCHEGQRLAGPPDSSTFHLYLGQLVDQRALDNMIPEILSDAGYNDVETLWFWEETLTEFAATAGQNALYAGVEELKLNVVIHIHNMARRLLDEEDEMVEPESLEIDGEGEFGGVPPSEASIRELEVVKYNDVEDEFEQKGCSICMEEFEIEKEVMRMPCKHIFHDACLMQWLERSHLCPLCRYEMPVEMVGDGWEAV